MLSRFLGYMLQRRIQLEPPDDPPDDPLNSQTKVDSCLTQLNSCASVLQVVTQGQQYTGPYMGLGHACDSINR